MRAKALFLERKGRGSFLCSPRPCTAYVRQQKLCPRPRIERRHPLS